MATQQGPKNLPPGGEKKDTYRYEASSFRVKTNEEELFELVQLSEVPIDKELLKVIFELLKLNIAPVAIVQVLKSLKAQSTATPPSSTSKDKTQHTTKPPSRLLTSNTSKPSSAKKTSKDQPSASHGGTDTQRRPSSKQSSRSLPSHKTKTSGSLRKDKTSSKS